MNPDQSPHLIMNNAIKQKEFDLKHSYELRDALLVSQLKERDDYIMDIRHRYELLREDSIFNIKLIEGRDEELKKLDSQLKQTMNKLNSADNEIKALIMKLSEAEHRNAEIETVRQNREAQWKVSLKFV